MLQLCAEQCKFWMAVVVAGLIWPEFVRVDEMVFLADRVDLELIDQWKQRLGDQPARIEEVVNHVHLWDVFPGEEADADPIVGQFANLLQESWSAKLGQDFPGQEFEVVATLEDAVEYGPSVTFFSHNRDSDMT